MTLTDPLVTAKATLESERNAILAQIAQLQKRAATSKAEFKL